MVPATRLLELLPDPHTVLQLGGPHTSKVVLRPALALRSRSIFVTRIWRTSMFSAKVNMAHGLRALTCRRVHLWPHPFRQKVLGTWCAPRRRSQGPDKCLVQKPSLKQVAKSVQAARARLGLQIEFRSNDHVERAVHTLRSMAKTLISHLESRAQIKLPAVHHVRRRAWALHNRFHVLKRTGIVGMVWLMEKQD